MLYLGVDLHKRSCWVTVLDADGHVVESRKLGTTRRELEEYFGQLAKPAQVAVKATFNWYYFLNVVEPLGLELHLVHPWKTRAIASVAAAWRQPRTPFASPPRASRARVGSQAADVALATRHTPRSSLAVPSHAS